MALALATLKFAHGQVKPKVNSTGHIPPSTPNKRSVSSKVGVVLSANNVAE